MFRVGYKKKTPNVTLRGVIYVLYRGFLHFQTAIRLHGTYPGI